MFSMKKMTKFYYYVAYVLYSLSSTYTNSVVVLHKFIFYM